MASQLPVHSGSDHEVAHVVGRLGLTRHRPIVYRQPIEGTPIGAGRKFQIRCSSHDGVFDGEPPFEIAARSPQARETASVVIGGGVIGARRSLRLEISIAAASGECSPEWPGHP